MSWFLLWSDILFLRQQVFLLSRLHAGRRGLVLLQCLRHRPPVGMGRVRGRAVWHGLLHQLARSQHELGGDELHRLPVLLLLHYPLHCHFPVLHLHLGDCPGLPPGRAAACGATEQDCQRPYAHHQGNWAHWPRTCEGVHVCVTDIWCCLLRCQWRFASASSPHGVPMLSCPCGQHLVTQPLFPPWLLPLQPSLPSPPPFTTPSSTWSSSPTSVSSCAGTWPAAEGPWVDVCANEAQPRRRPANRSATLPGFQTGSRRVTGSVDTVLTLRQSLETGTSVPTPARSRLWGYLKDLCTRRWRSVGCPTSYRATSCKPSPATESDVWRKCRKVTCCGKGKDGRRKLVKIVWMTKKTSHASNETTHCIYCRYSTQSQYMWRNEPISSQYATTSVCFTWLQKLNMMQTIADFGYCI